jgi:LacI family transcriptional regulator
VSARFLLDIEKLLLLGLVALARPRASAIIGADININNFRPATMNLKGLANLLGVSKTTVSRALNGYPEVNGRTRERVLAAAREAGYEANPLARGLAVGRQNVFGMIHSLAYAEMADPFFLSLMGGMSAALEQSRINLFIAPVSSHNEQPSYEQMVRGRRVDALVVGRTRVQDERIAYLSRAGFPFVAHGRTSTSAPYAWFDYDNEAGMRLASGRLLGLGHQRIALISAPLAFTFARQRRDSFLRTLAGAGLAADPRHLVDGVQERRQGYAAMRTLLATSPRPSAVIVDNHLAGIGAVSALLDAGIQLGSGMSVIVWGSVDDTLVGAHVSTVEQPDPQRAGARIGDMLQALLAGTPPGELQELWQPVLLPGASVGHPCLA